MLYTFTLRSVRDFGETFQTSLWCLATSTVLLTWMCFVGRSRWFVHCCSTLSLLVQTVCFVFCVLLHGLTGIDRHIIF